MDTNEYLKLLHDNSLQFSLSLYDSHLDKFNSSYAIDSKDVPDLIDNYNRLIAKYMYGLKDEKVIEFFLNDRFAYEAKRYKVDISFYRRYHSWYMDRDQGIPQCTGLTRKGKRCKNGIPGTIPEPDNFIFGVSDRCHAHKGYE